MAFISISMADLMLIPGFPEAYGDAEEDDSALKAILHGCGLDVTKEFDWHYCTHRKLDGEIVTCYRVEGYERSDREWLDCEQSSYDARIDSYDDLEFRKELRNMLHISCVDTAFKKV